MAGLFPWSGGKNLTALEQKSSGTPDGNSNKLKSIRLAETVVGPSPQSEKRAVRGSDKSSHEVTAPSVLREKLRSEKSEKKRQSKEDDGVHPLFFILVPAGILALAFAIRFYLQSADHLGAEVPEVENVDTNFADRVKHHRDEVGFRLNRERIGVEYENRTSAPPLPPSATRAPEPDMLSGLPLSGEGHHRKSSRDKSVPLNPDFADARVEYELKEQQLLNEQDQIAQKKYVEEFIANAARGGYRVRVDKNGKVIVLGRIPVQDPSKEIRLNLNPGSQNGGPSAPGASQ